MLYLFLKLTFIFPKSLLASIYRSYITIPRTQKKLFTTSKIKINIKLKQEISNKGHHLVTIYKLEIKSYLKPFVSWHYTEDKDHLWQYLVSFPILGYFCQCLFLWSDWRSKKVCIWHWFCSLLCLSQKRKK